MDRIKLGIESGCVDESGRVTALNAEVRGGEKPQEWNFWQATGWLWGHRGRIYHARKVLVGFLTLRDQAEYASDQGLPHISFCYTKRLEMVENFTFLKNFPGWHWAEKEGRPRKENKWL